MKILKIGILNLNSLRGQQTIDFVNSPLADHRLYAIVGPTGAGKTTILDAITLALYGQTERNKSEKDRKDGSGSVMTYGEGECRAELEYETAAGRYRNVWHRQRAHKKPNRDLTASHREINKWNPATKQWDIMATKKREVDARTEQIVGLDYERFVRSVLLTQGDFARFLRSDPGNKAAILEKITGTGVYKDLSMAAFARAKAARENLERATTALTVAPPLTAQQRQLLDQQTSNKKAEIAPLKKTLAAVTAQLNLHDALLGLQKKERSAAAERERLEAAWTAFAADRERLAHSDALLPLRADLDAEHRLDREDRQLTTDLKALDREATRLTTAVEKNRAVVVAAQDRLNDFYDKLPGRERKFAQVAQWEREIAVLLRDAELDRKRKASTEKSLAERSAKVRRLTTEATAVRRELAGLEPAEIQRKLSGLEVTIPEATARRAALTQRLERRRLQDRLTEETTRTESLEKELAAADRALSAARRVLNRAETALADRRAILTNLIVSQSLAEHKTNLEPGQECPVCGATEHPGLENFVPVTNSAVERTQRDVNQALTAQQKAKRALATAQTTHAGLQRRHDGQRALLEELSKRLGPTTPPEPATAGALTAELSALTDRLTNQEAERTKLRRLRTNLPRLLALETELVALRQRTTELEAELKGVNSTLDKATREAAAKKEKIHAEVKDNTAEECREKLRRRKDRLTQQLSTAEKEEVDVKGQRAALTARRKVIRERRETVRGELTAVRARLTGGLGKLRTTVPAARLALLSESTAAHLRARHNELLTRRVTTKSVSETLASQIAAAAKALAGVPDRDALSASCAETEFAVSEANRLIGALELQIRQDDERIAGVAARKAAIDGLRREADRRQRLSDLIGSADGKKFRSYAQAITLQQLIAIGNDHLAGINPRYRMEYEAPAPGAPERLEMIVIDRYQNDNRRTMATLSGGESFLISLALALGLSDLASGKSLIRSLFIDEGFGTLDGKTLDQAMTTLEQLQAQGKTIGLISHVPALQERIYCQIQLERVGDGFSAIRVRG